MNFERAKREFNLQEEIREQKVDIKGGAGKELEGLLQKSLEYLDEMRNTPEGLQNESVILNLAEELDIDREKLQEEYLNGLRFNIKAAFRSGLINEDSTEEDTQAVIGAYTLNFRSTLNHFEHERQNGKKESPVNILKIAKNAYLLAPTAISDLREKYQNNPDVDDVLIKHFVLNNPKNSEKMIDNAVNNLVKLRNDYQNNPDVEDWMLKRAVLHNLKDPEGAVKIYAEKIAELKVKFPEMDSRTIKYFSVNSPKNSEEAMKKFLQKMNELRVKYENNADIDEWMLKHVAMHNPEDPEKAVNDALRNMAFLRRKYRNESRISDDTIRFVAVNNPVNPEDAIEKILKDKSA